VVGVDVVRKHDDIHALSPEGVREDIMLPLELLPVDDVPEEVGILVPRCDAPILLGWAVHENPPQLTVLGLGSVLHVIH